MLNEVFSCENIFLLCCGQLYCGIHQAPVVERPDNFIQRISHNPTVSICAKISVSPRAKYAHSDHSLIGECTKTLDNI